MTTITTNASYYNPRVSNWEPILELSRISVEMIQNEIADIKNLICIQLEKLKDSEIEQIMLKLNISTQFLSTFFQMKRLLESEITQLHLLNMHEEQNDMIE